MKMNQKGIIQPLLVVSLLIVGVVATVYLVLHPQIFKGRAALDQNQNSLTLGSKDLSVLEGAKFTVPIFIRTNKLINLISASIKYPADILELVSIDQTIQGPNIIKQWVDVTQDLQKGTASIVGAVPGSSGYITQPNNSKIVTTLEFKVKANTIGKNATIRFDDDTQIYQQVDGKQVADLSKNSLQVIIPAPTPSPSPTATPTSIPTPTPTLVPTPTPFPSPTVKPQPIDCQSFNGNIDTCVHQGGDKCAWYSCTNRCLTNGTPLEQGCDSNYNPAAPVTKKVLQVIYNPTLVSGQKLYDYKGWPDPVSTITPSIISALSEGSGGYINYQIAETQVRNEFPRKTDGFRYTETTYNDCRSNSNSCHFPDDADYNQMWTDLNICSKVSSGQVDEIWVYGAGYFGFDEYAMKIPNDVMPYNNPTDPWLYPARKKNIPDCNGKTIWVMGFVPEVGLPNSIHDFGHRAENALGLTIGRGYWDICKGNSDFDDFSCSQDSITATSPSQVPACGDTHTPPNMSGGRSYIYDSAISVPAACGSWKNYPFTSKKITNVDCNAWGCSDVGYYKWWFSNMPRTNGKAPNGNLKNWLKYVFDFDNAVAEMKGSTLGVSMQKMPWYMNLLNWLHL